VKVDLPIILNHDTILEENYPTILQEIKTKMDSNDPGIIRAHFIPTLVAKNIVEKYPEVKTIWIGEAFTYEYLEMNMPSDSSHSVLTEPLCRNLLESMNKENEDGLLNLRNYLIQTNTQFFNEIIDFLRDNSCYHVSENESFALV
jgi:hypothetical protein